MANNNNNESSGDKEDLFKLAECPICTELKTDHRILVSCGHSFCLDDIDAIVSTSKNTLLCPLCRKPFVVPTEGTKSLIKDFHKIALVELALKWQNSSKVTEPCSECAQAATQWCQEDECLFCDTHAEEAHRFGKSKYHTLVSPSKKVVKAKCKAHKKEMEKYCKACDSIICIDCFVFDHVGHKIDNLETVVDEKKKNLVTDWKAVEEPLTQKLVEEEKQLEQISTLATSNHQTVVQHFQSYIEKVVAALEKRKQDVLNNLNTAIENQKNQISARKEQLQRSLAEVKMQSQMLSSSLSHGDSVQWISMERSVRKEFGKWTWDQPPLVYSPITVNLPQSLHNTISQIGTISIAAPQVPKQEDHGEQVAQEPKPKPKAKRQGSALPGEVPAKKVKKVKDPLAPKRNVSAYMHFCQACRPQVKLVHPELKMTDISLKLAEMWKEISDQAKKEFVLRAESDKKRYEKEKREYIEKNGGKPALSEPEDSEDSD